MSEFNVSEWLVDQSDLKEKKSVHISDKLPDFVIRSLTATEFESARLAGVRKYKNRAGALVTETDEEKVNDKLMEMAIIVPELDNSELQTMYGTIGKPLATLRAMLTIGQYVELSNQVQELSGFDINAEVEEVKN